MSKPDASMLDMLLCYLKSYKDESLPVKTILLNMVSLALKFNHSNDILPILTHINPR